MSRAVMKAVIDIVKIDIRIDVIEFARLDQGVKKRHSLCSIFIACKETIIAEGRNGSDGPLYAIVVSIEVSKACKCF
nr:hypothetical protein [Chitinophaga silvisoli]